MQIHLRYCLVELIKGAIVLILTRKLGEKIIINENIQVELLKVGDNQASIGIQAPLDVIIHREEVLQRILAGHK